MNTTVTYENMNDSLLTVPLIMMLQMRAENETYRNDTMDGTNEGYAVPTTGVDFEIRKFTMPILCIIGLITNTLAAIMFLGKSLRGFSCCIFLGVRSVSDNGFLVSVFFVWLDFVDVRIFHTVGICHTVVFLAYICSFLSVWCVVCVTIENYVRICHPMMIKLYCTSKTAIMLVVFLSLISVCIYNMPLWSNEIVYIYESYYCITKKKYQNLQFVLTYIDTAMTLIIPIIIIFTLMVVIIYRGVEASKRKLRLGHHRSKYRTAPSYGAVAGLLSAVSITFLFLHTPVHIFKLKVIIETVTGQYTVASQTDRTVGNIFQVMYYLNFSINFVVYFICGKNVRRVFKESLKRNISCLVCDCQDEIDEDRVSEGGTTELTLIVEKFEAHNYRS